jgi:hypothetical protein
MAMTDFGKKQSDWWVPAVTGGIVGGLTPWMMRQISPVLDSWFEPSDTMIRTLFEGGASGLVLGFLILAVARLVLGANFGRRS